MSSNSAFFGRLSRWLRGCNNTSMTRNHKLSFDCLEDRCAPAVLVVNNVNDGMAGGVGELRTVVNTAQSGDKIVFRIPSRPGDPPPLIQLQGQISVIDKILEFDGEISQVAITSNNGSRAFSVTGTGVIPMEATFTRIRFVRCSANGGDGGAIFARAAKLGRLGRRCPSRAPNN